VRDVKLDKAAITLVCLSWIAWAVWSQFLSIPTGEIENHSSLSVKDRMNDCSGSFKQRYDCKNAIVIETDRETFLNMIERIAIVTVPPLMLVGGWRLLSRRRDDDDGAGGDEWSEQTQYRRRYHRRSSSRHS
jgi:hypothetical protein